MTLPNNIASSWQGYYQPALPGSNTDRHSKSRVRVDNLSHVMPVPSCPSSAAAGQGPTGSHPWPAVCACVGGGGGEARPGGRARRRYSDSDQESESLPQRLRQAQLGSLGAEMMIR